jgi:hypothetical protein
MTDHTHVILCGSCDRRADLILDGIYLCSTHGLIIVMAQLEERVEALTTF